MKNKIRILSSFAVCVALVLNLIPIGLYKSEAASFYIPENIDGGYDEARMQFYYDTSCLISEYWEDSYFTEYSYTKKNGAARVSGKWYLPADDFEDYEASYSYKGKDMVPLDSISESGLFEIDSTKKEVTIDRPYQMKRLIVKLKKGKINPRYYGAVKYSRDDDGTYVLQFSTEEATKAAYEKLSAKTSKVEYVETDRYVAMIEPESILGGNTSAAGYGSTSGWENEMLGTEMLAERLQSAGLDNAVTVAIVDTGVDYTHPLLSSHVSSKGYDFINSDYDAYDDNSHGTHVAGIVVNTMSGTNVNILPVKVLGADGSGSNLSVANGILYAAECGADVINLSLGGSSYGSGHYEDQAISTAISKGSVVVVAAGNDSSDTAYSCPAHNSSTIVVAAVDSSRQKAYFSNYGNTVDVAAPGVDIYSSIPNGQYDYYSGTSMATPHISGLAAMLKKVYPSYSCSEIEKLLTSYCVDAGSAGFDVYYGNGIPYVANLELNVSSPTSAPTQTPGPTQTPTSVPTQTPGYPTATPTSTPVNPTSTPIQIPDYGNWDGWDNWDWPTATPTAVPTRTPVKPTSTPILVPTQTPVKPTATPIVVPTQTPVVPITTPINYPVYGDTSTSISTSTQTTNGTTTTKITISAGTGVQKVVVYLYDGVKNYTYEFLNEGNGINRWISMNYYGNGRYAYIYSYDYYGNIVQSSTVSF